MRNTWPFFIALQDLLMHVNPQNAFG